MDAIASNCYWLQNTKYRIQNTLPYKMRHQKYSKINGRNKRNKTRASGDIILVEDAVNIWCLLVKLTGIPLNAWCVLFLFCRRFLYLLFIWLFLRISCKLNRHVSIAAHILETGIIKRLMYPFSCFQNTIILVRRKRKEATTAEQKAGGPPGYGYSVQHRTSERTGIGQI